MHKTLALVATMFAALPAWAAHQDWQVLHQPDRFVDRVMMEAYADSDSGPGRMALYCDTESGFRVMFMPHRHLLPEGPVHLAMRIDDGQPLNLDGDAFGDDTTDVVTIHGSGKIEQALSAAGHVRVHFQGAAGDEAFTFGHLAGERPLLMKVCPLPK